MKQLIAPLASLRLSVVLFAASMFLILAGTLAQVEQGVWTVVDQYFRSLVVRIELQLFFPRSLAEVPGAFLFPGGLTLGVLLFINLLAAHAVRFKLSWKRSGIILAHAGVLLLLVGEFVTGALSDEGVMPIDEGASASYIDDIREAELAIIDRSDPDRDRVIVIPERVLVSAARTGRPIIHELLPVRIRVNDWLPNSYVPLPAEMPPNWKPRATVGFGTQVDAFPLPPATGVTGVETDYPSAYITLWNDANRPYARYLVTTRLRATQGMVADGNDYDIALRFRRTYKPYTVHLIDFTHEKFVGTETPRNFSSRVRLEDPERSVDREALISMNNPLRYRGETFYQLSYKANNTGTVLQVVDNPGWILPYVSCILVTLGMLVHFGVRFASFSRKQRR